MELIHQGKVRDVYADGGDLVLVASDRVSVYDVVLPTPIPGKGALLTALSAWWFEQLADIVPNHVISADDVPAEFAGRALRVKRLEILKVEAVVRGYLTGSGLAEYDKRGTVCGNDLPAGLVDGSRLPEPIYTPTTKADIGDHDLPMTYEETAAKLGPDLAARIRDLTFAIYNRGAEIALDKGIIIADTKFEFGLDADGTLRLADEVLTSDSSRFWEAAAWKPGQTQPSFDKQYVRDWARSTGWKPDDAEAPEIPQDVADATLARYIEAYELLTGRRWQ
ncbi:phosphoribosylaminoimidazolesuccinocarboxamide synthase [Glycomyces algeriensis]|uniref:Phosphoribosylaminoimidazole-succinocarboxamide synthase n=1 Tax=Glycomyces algeriensis TaxID=256037 RepID=A0A9W6G7F5_9ACTN|nr:phosphoribosylaminoimidazolesuccinocarboxamide synthase [Glycomyces algeriensis]MDA1365074.1 phosphoribosylaminoimidazolesuccinocarboxamide synthase [Glycomyces algeriensis]MDR7349864.1 phosphoribosylaminoimidazole-succinocarboxamide synthase [Glycomyces algeriensis]GLI42575.1 phosphoribosylaminoimidazole-succinocarboxamide synthase [Glycomyces algeriensis]